MPPGTFLFKNRASSWQLSVTSLAGHSQNSHTFPCFTKLSPNTWIRFPGINAKDRTDSWCPDHCYEQREN